MTHQIRIAPCWLVVCCCAAFIPQSKTTGQTVSTWQAPGVASWNDPANWSAGVPDQAGDHAIFGPGAPAGDVTVLLANPTTAVGTLTYDNANTLSLFAPTMMFDGDGSAALIDVLNGNLIFNTGAFSLNTELDLSVAPSSTATVGIGFNPAVSLTGPGGLNVLGGGLVVFNGANTYGGATHIHNGTVRVFNNASLGAGTGVDADGTFIHTGGTLEIASNSITLPNEKIIIDGGTLTGGAWKLGGPVQLDDGTINGTNWTLNGPLTLNGGDVNGLDWTIAGPLVAAGGSLNGRNWSIQGPVSLDGELTVSGGIGIVQSAINGAGGIRVDTPTGILQLSQSNGYLGQTVIQNGTVQATHNSALGAGTGVDADGTIVHTGGKLFIGAGRQIGNEKLTLQGGTLEGASFTYGGPIVSDGGTISVSNTTINGGIELVGGLTLKGGNSGNRLAGGFTGPGDLAFNGGIFELLAPATRAGSTHIQGGAEVTLRSSSALGTGPIVIDDGELWVINPIALPQGKTTIRSAGQLYFQDVTSANIDLLLEGGTIHTVGNTVLTGQIELGTGTSTINSSPSRTLNLGPDIFGGGDLRYAVGVIELNRDYGYTGQTIIDGSSFVRVNSPLSLGDTTTGTLIKGGQLSILSATAEDLTIRGGLVSITAPAGAFTGTITMSGGRLTQSQIQQPITLEPGISTISSSLITGGLLGTGDVVISNATVDGAPLAHDGGVTFAASGGVTLNTPNTYSGVTTLSSGTTTVNHPGVFGNTFEPTVLDGGELIANVAMPEPLEIRRGTFRNFDNVNPYTGTITLNRVSSTNAAIDGVGIYTGDIVLAGFLDNVIRGGTFNGEIRGESKLLFFGDTGSPIVLNSANTHTNLTWIYAGRVDVNHPQALGSTDRATVVNSGLLALNVSAPERIVLEDDGTIELNIQQPRLPEILPGAAGTIVFNTPSAYSGPVLLQDAKLQVNQDTTLSGIVVNGQGRIAVAPGASLHIADHEILLHAGTIEAATTGLNTIRKQTSGRATIGDMPGFNGRVELDKGILTLKQGASGAGGVHLNQTERAYIDLAPNLVLTADVYLNNSRGINQGGALITPRIFSSSQKTPVIQGAVHLGDQGAYIGGDTMILAGPITGGSLTTVGENARLMVTNGANTYTGVTDIHGAGLQLLEQGTLTTTERIIVHHGAYLTTDNRDQNITDRVADHIPIELRGGGIGIVSTTGVSTSEAYGELILASGVGVLDADDETARSMTFASLTHLPGAMVEFEKRDLGSYYFQTAPTLTNGMIGGWAKVITDGQAWLASYNASQGVVPMIPTVTDITTAGPNDNVRMSQDALTLQTDTTVNSLFLGGDLNLNGNTLRIKSGGLIGNGGFNDITNGYITAGDGNGGTLYAVPGIEDPQIASIVDDGDGVVNLVVGGGYLGGVNTYSGSTTVNRGTMRVLTETALPGGTDLIIHGGKVEFNYIGNTTQSLGTLRMLDGASLVEVFGGGSVVLDFQALELEEGTIGRVELVGDGTVRKTTPGTVVLDTSGNPNFSGTVEVYEGTLESRWHSDLGDAPITVYGGVFFHRSRSGPAMTNPITLAGGTLAGHDDTFFAGPIQVNAASAIETIGGRVEISGSITGDAPLIFDQQIGDTGEIRVRSDNTGFSGPVDIVGGYVRLHRDAIGGLGTGPVTIHTGARLLLEPLSSDSQIRLNGGELAAANTPNTLTGSLEVTGDSFLGVGNSDHGMILEAQTTMRDGVRLTQINGGTVTVRGGLWIGQNVTVYAQEGTFDLEGDLIPNDAQATLNLIEGAFGRIEFGAGVRLESGRRLSIMFDGEPAPLTFDTDGQTVSGNGTLGNSLILGPGAVIAPGASAGMLTVDGDYTQLLDAVMRIELGGTGPGDYDRLIITGMFNVGGVFELLLLDGFIPGIGDVFDVLDFNALVPGSAFDQLSLPELGPGRGWDTSALLTSGEVRVVPEPGGAIGLGLTGLLLRRCRRHTVAERT